MSRLEERCALPYDEKVRRCPAEGFAHRRSVADDVTERCMVWKLIVSEQCEVRVSLSERCYKLIGYCVEIVVEMGV
jgi:hypothetical protein